MLNADLCKLFVNTSRVKCSKCKTEITIQNKKVAGGIAVI